MKIKITLLILCFIISNLGISSIGSCVNNYYQIDIINQNSDIQVTGHYTETIKIRIALYSMEDIYATMNEYYLDILDGYKWNVGTKTYEFIIDKIYDEDISRNILNVNNYDVLVISAMEADSITTERFIPTMKNKIWINKIRKFIEDGGGYFGSCASANIATKTASNSKMSYKIMDIDIGISSVQTVQYGGIPFISQLGGKPENIGPSAYEYFSGWDANNESHWFGGAPLDISINKNNPIFDDLIEEKRRIFWCAGPSFILPDNKDKNVSILAYYPEEEISDNESTRIHAWRYSGGILGFIRGFSKAIKKGDTLNNCFSLAPFFATDWECTNKIIQTNYSCKPFMTMETYPNKNEGRIILCAGHPEMQVFWGGHINEKKDDDDNNLFDGLHYWSDIIPFNQTLQDEIRYNWWIVRRHAAWVAKVADNDLPPIYGPSQVCDIYPYEQPSNFNLTGIVESSNLIESLDLYYRYSTDNISWTDWIYYNKSTNEFSWEFDSPKGSGYYQFYSIRNILNEYEQEIECAPKGPDAIVYVNSNRFKNQMLFVIPNEEKVNSGFYNETTLYLQSLFYNNIY